jgi:hypothetical protein
MEKIKIEKGWCDENYQYYLRILVCTGSLCEGIGILFLPLAHSYSKDP